MLAAQERWYSHATLQPRSEADSFPKDTKTRFIEGAQLMLFIIAG